MIRPRLVFPVFAVILIATVFLSLALGRYPVDPAEIIAYFGQKLLGMNSLDQEKFQALETVILHIRLPRIAAAVLVGAALSVSGATLQSIFINPLVSPGILGILAGSSFGAALGMIFSSTWTMMQINTVFFGMAAMAFALFISRLYQGDKILLLVLGGIISGSLFNSLFLLIKYIADPYNQLPAIVYWLMGGLSLADSGTILLLSVPITLGIITILCLSPYLNILTMGEEEAQSLGVNARFWRTLLIVVAALISSLSVALCGIIGWIGLVIPHICRILVGPDNRVLLPATVLMGAFFLLVVDDVSRMICAVEIPISILTSLTGIPIFAAILGKGGKGWSGWN